MNTEGFRYPAKFDIVRAMRRGEAVWADRRPHELDPPWKNGLYRQIAFLALDYVLRRVQTAGYTALSASERCIYDKFVISEQQERRAGQVREYCNKHAVRIRANADQYAIKAARYEKLGKRLRTDEYWIIYLTEQIRKMQTYGSVK